ncbi:DnaB-like helicase N-terminal domain-containing protein [Streptomyces sp. SAJ15]|uniref:DnaB-like helicase N-terminal domain-containing protein n=1 Tax=Streptomyces sp. SAJ15 TaxID=2011095 RepID=UPI0021B4C67F|nr:DnaB-like helicase N-terminal domain-containing protein [Streptomyces sp. SAJ15]
MAEGETDAQPPHDLAAEAAVLRAMLRSTEAIADIVEVLHSHDFYRPAHELIYTTILDLYSRNETPDPASVGSALDKKGQLAEVGGHAYLYGLVGSPSRSRSWLSDAERVQATAVLRRTKEAAVHIENLAAEGTAEDVDRIVDTVQAEIFAATARCRTGLPPSYSFSEVMEETLDELEAAGSRNQHTGIPTGFTDLDALTGGLYPGQLVVIAGRPAMGKFAGTATATPSGHRRWGWCAGCRACTSCGRYSAPFRRPCGWPGR